MIIHRKDKKKMANMVEDILYTAGELMHCVEQMQDDDLYGNRNYGDRYIMGRDGGRYGDRDWDEMDEVMERRRRRRM